MAQDKVASTKALEGIRILDIGRIIAGPFAMALLADFGAEVIKVEQPGEGDNFRASGPKADGIGLWWVNDNRNKKTITLNLDTAEGREILKKLVAKSDVLMENFRTGTMERWGLAYDQLKEVNPGIILVRVSGFGQTGPYRGKGGYGRVAESIAGFTFITGFPDRPPMRAGINVGDYMTAMFAAVGTLTAITHKLRTGEGQEVDVAMHEALFRVLEHTAMVYDKLGTVRQRRGNASEAAGSNLYQTADGKWFAIVAVTDNLFAQLLQAMGREDLLKDERFALRAKREENYDLVDGTVAEWVATQNARDVQKRMDDFKVPGHLVNDISDIFQDPHYQAREDIVYREHPQLGKVAMSNVVPRFSKTPGEVKWPGMPMGWHNEEIYEGLLGMSKNEVESLKSKGVI